MIVFPTRTIRVRIRSSCLIATAVVPFSAGVLFHLVVHLVHGFEELLHGLAGLLLHTFVDSVINVLSNSKEEEFVSLIHKESLCHRVFHGVVVVVVVVLHDVVNVGQCNN